MHFGLWILTLIYALPVPQYRTVKGLMLMMSGRDVHADQGDGATFDRSRPRDKKKRCPKTQPGRWNQGNTTAGADIFQVKRFKNSGYLHGNYLRQ